jgi:hypothetical protein
MPGFLFHVNASAMCPHAGQAQTVSANTRVFVNGMPVALMTDTTLITACPFNVSGKPQPCLRVQWTVGATRVLINGQPPLIQTSMGLCLSPEQAPQGAPLIITTQTRVMAI